MLLAEVEGRVWITQEIDALQGRTTLATKDLASGSRQVAVDLVGAAVGDRVLVATGSPASMALGGAAVDAVVVALVEGSDVLGSR